MILKMIISVILLYYLAVLWQYFRHDLMRSFWKTDAEEADDEPEEKTEEPYTVIGKSTYRKRQTDEPDDKQRRADNQADKTDNFAAGTPENDVEQPEETATADDDDADYSDIEVEPEEDEEEEAEEEEYIPTPEEVDEEEGLGAYYPDGNPDFATGYTFEDLKKVHRIMVTDDVNEQEKQPAVMGSDVWDEMLDEFEGARQRVARLMNNNNV